MASSSRNRGFNNPGGHSSKSGGGGFSSVNIDESHLESLNNSLAENLASKIGTLKNLAIDLDNESHDHLPLLDGMDGHMETGTWRLSGTMDRLNGMARSRGFTGRKLTFSVALASCTILFLLYYFLLHR